MLLRGNRTTAGATRRTVIDYIALALSHALLLLALIRIVSRGELDSEPELDIERKRPGRSSSKHQKGNQKSGGGHA